MEFHLLTYQNCFESGIVKREALSWSAMKVDKISENAANALLISNDLQRNPRERWKSE